MGENQEICVFWKPTFFGANDEGNNLIFHARLLFEYNVALFTIAAFVLINGYPSLFFCLLTC